MVAAPVAAAPPGQVLRPHVQDDLEQSSSGLDESEAGDGGQRPPDPTSTEPFQTLRSAGPMATAGSGGHPDGCMPCTFYCFARRGCNRSADCRFCHLMHQSKLQQRREAWKQLQREKRKLNRERSAQEAATSASQRRPSGSAPALEVAGTCPAANLDLFTLLGDQAQKAAAAASACGRLGPAAASHQSEAGQAMARPNAASGGRRSSEVFSYRPDRAILTIGQEAEFQPLLNNHVFENMPLQFRAAQPLPVGLSLNPQSGVVSAFPSVALKSTAVVVEADLPGGRTMSAVVQVEVVDFTCGGFTIGHLSEFEPGKYMVLLSVPSDDEEAEADQGNVIDGLLSQYDLGPSVAVAEKQNMYIQNGVDLAALSAKLQLGSPELPSAGSLGHYVGDCKPCAFQFKGGCQIGAACTFCHLCDQEEKRRRKKEARKELRRKGSTGA